MVEPMDPNRLNDLLWEGLHKGNDQLPNEAEHKFSVDETIDQMIIDLFAAEGLGRGDVVDIGYVKDFTHKDQVTVEYYELINGEWKTTLTRRFKIVEVKDDSAD